MCVCVLLLVWYCVGSIFVHLKGDYPFECTSCRVSNLLIEYSTPARVLCFPRLILLLYIVWCTHPLCCDGDRCSGSTVVYSRLSESTKKKIIDCKPFENTPNYWPSNNSVVYIWWLCAQTILKGNSIGF